MFQKISSSEKVFGKAGGGNNKVSFENLCLKVSINAEGEHFSLSLISGIEKKLMGGLGGKSVKVFRRKFPVSQCRKLS